jgi:uncharacterized protein (DUF2062 family)
MKWNEVILSGVIIAIPIAIIGNILTRPVQNRFDSLLKRQSERREKERAEFRELVDRLAKDQAGFSGYLVVAVLRTTFYTAVFGLLSGMAFAAAQLIQAAAGSYYLSLSKNFIDLLYVAGQLAALMGALIVVAIVRAALQTAAAVREAQNV